MRLRIVFPTGDTLGADGSGEFSCSNNMYLSAGSTEEESGPTVAQGYVHVAKVFSGEEVFAVQNDGVLLAPGEGRVSKSSSNSE